MRNMVKYRDNLVTLNGYTRVFLIFSSTIKQSAVYTVSTVYNTRTAAYLPHCPTTTVNIPFFEPGGLNKVSQDFSQILLG